MALPAQDCCRMTISEQIEAAKRATVRATPNAECPRCIAKARHPAGELKRYHPLSGHGTSGATQCQCGNAACPCI